MSQPQAFGEPVPDFTLRSPSGDAVTLSRAVVGKRGALVFFWSGICSHCRRYDGWLRDFAARRPELALLVVASRQNEDAAAVERAIRDRSLGFDVLLDGDRAVARAFRVEQTPRVFLLGPGRRLLYRGAVDNFKYPRDADYEAYLDAAIEDLLAGRGVRRAETPSFGCPVESVYYRA